MENKQMMVAKFGVPSGGEIPYNVDYTKGILCKVCGLNYWAHNGDVCYKPAILATKFPKGFSETSPLTGKTTWNYCEVCKENGGKHYQDGAVCPKDYSTYAVIMTESGRKGIWYRQPVEIGFKAKKTTVTVKDTYKPRTQKARGISALKQYSRRVPEFKVIPIEKVTPEELVGKFVRPCPMRPRHGFVDSRLITSLDEANRIIEETRAADPEAEFLTMKKIDAEYSGIFTPGLLAIGPGNDGATAGNNSVTLPVMGTPFADGYRTNEMLKAASIENAPYLELLWKGVSEHGPFEVQLRDGPKLPQTIDLIPAKVTVNKVELAGGDLLEWESKIKTFTAGTVVYHPGGTLASHYAVHAALNNVPVVISHEPKVGETLVPTETEIRKVDIRKLRAGYSFASKMDLTQEEAAYLMITGCHHVAAWQGKHDYLLGAAMGAAWRLTLIAVLGEFRHWGGSTAEGQMRIRRRNRNISRESVYGGYWSKADEPVARFRFRRALYSFAHDSWSSSFGGKSWFRFGQWALQMHNALVEGNGDRALETLNSLVHSAHNNGWGFNKFITDSELDRTASNPVYAALRCGSALYRIESLNKDKAMSLFLAKSFMKYRRPLKEIAHDIDLTPTLADKKKKKADRHLGCENCGNCIGCGDCTCNKTPKLCVDCKLPIQKLDGCSYSGKHPIKNQTYEYSPIISAQVQELPGEKFKIQYVTEADKPGEFRVLNGNMNFPGALAEFGKEKRPSLDGDGSTYYKMAKSTYSSYGDAKNEVWSIGSPVGYYIIIPSGKN